MRATAALQKVLPPALWCFAAALLAAGCGGSSAPPVDPVAPRAAAAAGETATPAPARVAARARPAGPCDDGSCFSCGDAQCFAGYFCAVGAASHGCSWLPACASRPTCACVGAALRDPRCTCEERSGGVYFTCDGATL